MALRQEQPLLLPWNEQANGFPVQRICFGPYGSAATHAVNTFCFCGVARTMFWLWRETTTAVSAVCRHGASAATESFNAFKESYRCQPQSCSSAAKEFLIGRQGALHRQSSAPSSAVSSECWWNHQPRAPPTDRICLNVEFRAKDVGCVYMHMWKHIPAQ